MNRNFLVTAALLGALTVAIGAFGAHGLKQVVSPESLGVFETAVRYQFYHVFALITTGILYKEFPFPATTWAGRLFIIGIILFSGSLYLLTWIKGAVIPGYNFIGAITPFGGLLFIGGWICLLISLFKNSNRQS